MISLQELDDLWVHIHSCHDAGYLICVSTGDDPTLEGTGISPTHCYSVLLVEQIEHERLIQIRDPRGQSTLWRGDWRDGSARWTSALR